MVGIESKVRMDGDGRGDGAGKSDPWGLGVCRK